MLVFVIGVLFSLVESYLLFRLLDFILGKKEGYGFSFYLAILGDTVLVLLCNYFIKVPEVTIVAAAVYEALISQKIIEGKLLPKILIILGYISMDFTIDLAAYILSMNILKADLAAAYDMNMLNSILTALSKLILCAVIYIGMFSWKKWKKELSRKYTAMLCAVPLVSIWVLIVLLRNGFSGGSPASFQSNGFFYLTLGGLLVVNLFVFHIFEKILEMEKEAQRLRDFEQEENFYGELKEYYGHATDMRYAYEAHLNEVMELVKKQDYQRLEQYLTEIQITMERYNFRKFTNDKMIDAVLSEKSCEAKAKGIEFYILTEFLEEQFKNPISICTLLEHVLDNALMDCERLMERGASYTFIKVKLFKEKKIDGCLISVVNTCEKPGAKYMDNKKRKELPLKSGTKFKEIEKLINRMDGICTYGYENKTFFFVARIPVQEFSVSA